MSLRASLICGAALAVIAGSQACALPVRATTAPIVNAGGTLPTITNPTATTLSVDLNAQRTIIDWSSFNVAPGESVSFYFPQQNSIALNRVGAGPINVNGQIVGLRAANPQVPPPLFNGGGIWLYSPQGVVFGPNAQVFSGGILATSAAPDVNAFLNASNVNIPFVSSGAGGPVTVASGARLSSTGYVALVAPRVDTAAGSRATSGDSGTVLYGAADSYEIQFFPTPDNDLTLFTFIVGSGAAGTPVGTNALNIASATTAGTAYLAAYSRAQLAGQLINAPGLITATSSIAAYGQVTVTTGRTILLGQVGTNSETQQVAGVTTGSVSLGEINADGNVNIHLAGTGSVGNLTATKIRSGQGLTIVANNITLGAGGLISGDNPDPSIGTRRNLFIDSGGLVTVPLIDSRGVLTITRAQATTNRTPSGNLNTLRLGTVSASQNILFNGASSIDAGAVTAGTEAQIFGSQTVRLTSLTTTAYTRISSSQNIVVGAIRGADIDLRSPSGITVNSVIGTNSVMLGTGGVVDVTSMTGPSLALDGGAVRLGSVAISGDARVRANSFDLLNNFSAANLTLENQTGGFLLGGTAQNALTNAEFQRIRVTGALNLYAGVTAATINVPTPVYGDFEIRDLDIDPARIPHLNVYAQNRREVRILGPAGPTAAGGYVRIGDPTPNSIWLPQTITFTDPSDPLTLDDLASPGELNELRLLEFYAGRDILIGSQRFVDLVRATPADQIDIGRGLPQGVAPTSDELGRIYLVASALTLVAGDRIVQQNTGSPGQELGIYLSGRGVPLAEPLLTLGGAELADVFVAFAGPNGLTFGQSAALSNRIALLDGGGNGGAQAAIRINGCPIGIGCRLSSPSTEFRIEAFRPVSLLPAIDPPLLTPPPPVDDDEREAEAVVTGTGNEEIWRREK